MGAGRGVHLALALWLAVSVVPATELPPGFVETVVLDPAAFGAGVINLEFTPDGDLLIGAKFGKIWRYSGGELTWLTTIPTSSSFHTGLLGMAVDPDFQTNQHVWVYYTTPAPARNRLSRLTLTGDDLTDETVVLDGPLLDSLSHHGGAMGFASDGTLFVTMGDDNLLAATSQDPFDLRGSLLRLNRDGSPAAVNPFLDGVAGDPRVYALGLRSPHRLTVQPGSDNVFIGDVGSNFFEELNVAVPGGNFGWPGAEGPNPPAQFGITYPVFAYVNGGTGCIMVGDFAEAGHLASQYEGSLFYADYARFEIRRVLLDASNLPLADELFASNTVARPVDLDFGPDGALYYVTWAPSELRKIAYVTVSNEQPVAVATLSADNGSAPLDVTLDGSASYDGDGDGLDYSWVLGDGNVASGPVVSHTYAAGEHHAVLTVDDGNGGQDSTVSLRIVSGNTRPTASITSPPDESAYVAGQTVSFSGTASDPEDGSLACPQFTWMVILHHAGQASLMYGPVQGSCGGNYSLPLRTFVEADQWYEFRLRVEDSGSPVGASGRLTGDHAVEIRPTTSTMSLRASPDPKLLLTLDGLPLNAPFDVDGVVGQLRTLGAVDPQPGPEGHTYRWLSWSDGGAAEHEIATPAAATTYTATFGCDVLAEVVNLQTTPLGGGWVQLTWDAVDDLCLAAGAERYRIYAGEVEMPPGVACDFPNDPPYALVGTSTGEQFIYHPGPGEQHFAVVGVGSDGQNGPVHCRDGDGDGTVDTADNCPEQGNPGQEDLDADGIGDVCDPCTDSDGDSIGDPGLPASTCGADNCPADPNPLQEDLDLDGVGDACDLCIDDPLNDDDGDLVCGAVDNCILLPNPLQEDADGDGAGDVCDVCPADPGDDVDQDTVCGDVDNCPAVYNVAQTDSDLDGRGDACDNCPLADNPSQSDGESDGVGDACDNCPAAVNPSQSDVDADLLGDHCDLEDGLIYLAPQGAGVVAWQNEAGYDAWNLYRGSLDVLLATGVYTQLPGSNPVAARWCGEPAPSVTDPYRPAGGRVAYYLVTGMAQGVESGLGSDSQQQPRPNDNPCP